MSIRPFQAARGLVGAGVGTATVLLIVTFVRHDRRLIEHLSLPKGAMCVEVAQTPEERARGLSGRKTIEGGLLLDWKAAGRHPIWMAGMQFPLDLVWINDAGEVLAVLPNVPACVQEPCGFYEPPGTEQSHAVLELPAGDAASYGLTAGTLIRRAKGGCARTREAVSGFGHGVRARTAHRLPF